MSGNSWMICAFVGDIGLFVALMYLIHGYLNDD